MLRKSRLFLVLCQHQQRGVELRNRALTLLVNKMQTQILDSTQRLKLLETWVPRVSEAGKVPAV